MKKGDLFKAELKKERVARLSEGTAKVPLIIDIPIGAIEVREQVRHSLEVDQALQELAKSMQEVGLLQPILVYPTKERTFVVIAGHRRLAAAKLLGWKTIRAIVKNPPHQGEKTVFQLVENLQREDLDPIDEALAYRELHENLGLSFSEIARRVGKSKGRVASVYKIVELILKRSAGGTLSPEAIAKAKEEFGGISPGILEELAVCVDKPYFEELLRLAKEGATRKEIRALRERLEAKLQRDKQVPSEKTISPYSKVEHYTAYGRIDLPAFALDTVAPKVEGILKETREKLEGLLPNNLAVKEVRIVIESRAKRKK